VTDLQGAAGSLKVRLQVVEAREPADFDGAISAAASGRAQALMVVSDPIFFQHRTRIADLALRHRLPSPPGTRLWTELWRFPEPFDAKLLESELAGGFLPAKRLPPQGHGVVDAWFCCPD
jgi:hypothetical protein